MYNAEPGVEITEAAWSILNELSCEYGPGHPYLMKVSLSVPHVAA